MTSATTHNTRSFETVIEDWRAKVQNRQLKWCREVTVARPQDVDGKYYLPHFHRFVPQGALYVFGVLESRWNGGTSWESWSTLGTPYVYSRGPHSGCQDVEYYIMINSIRERPVRGFTDYHGPHPIPA